VTVNSLIQIANQRPVLEEKLRESISKICLCGGEILSADSQEYLFKLLLNVPKWVFMLEMRALDGFSSNSIPSNISAFNDDEKHVAAILKKGKYSEWDQLTKNEKDDARRKWRRFRAQKIAFSEGRPSPYTSLVIKFIESIEMVSGSPFSYTYDSYSNCYKGAKLNALMVALDLALFASGAPSPSTIRDIHLKRQ